MSWRTKRRLIYLSIFFLIILLASFLVYLKFQKPKEQCFNNRQDQNEEGIDCGGPCPPCELKNFQFFKIYSPKVLIYLDKTFDLLGTIENPNQNLGLKKIRYQFLIYDLENNLQLQTPIEETILLPLEKRYLLKVKNQPVDFLIGKTELKIFNPDKSDFIKIEPEKLPLTYYNQKFYKDDNRWKAKLTVFNNSFKILENIEMIAFVYNGNNLISLTKGSYSFAPQEAKEIVLTLPELVLDPNGLEIYFQRTILEQ